MKSADRQTVIAALTIMSGFGVKKIQVTQTFVDELLESIVLHKNIFDDMGANIEGKPGVLGVIAGMEVSLV